MAQRDRPLHIPYNQVPHGLWTADLTPKAAMLLGWLHSHADNYLSRLSINRIATEFGGGRTSVTRLLSALESAGFVRVDSAPRVKAHVILLSEPWERLARKHVSGEDQDLPHDGTRACPTMGQDLVPPRDNREEQGEEQVEKNTENDVFDDFWALYPRRAGKPAARKALTAALKKANPADIGDGLQRWVRFWAAAKTDPQFIPHPATWLNQERWADMPPPIKQSGASYARQQAERIEQQR